MKRTALALLLIACIAGIALAEGSSEEPAYPRRDITFIIGFGAGGGTDTMGRHFVTAMEKQIPEVNLVPTNMAGAGGTVGANHVYNSPPDGYTLFIAHPGIPVPYLRGNFDKSFEDFTPVASFADSTVAMYVNGSSSYETVDDIVAAARANPDTLIMGVSVGTLIHLASLHVEDHNSVSFKEVSIGGGSPKPPELLSGRIDTYLSSIAEGAPYVQSGDFRALAVYGTERVSVFPDVPTFDELGYPYKFGQTFGLWAPPDTPREIIDYLSAAAEKACQDPDFIEALAVTGVRPGFRTPEGYGELLEQSFAELEDTARLLQ